MVIVKPTLRGNCSRLNSNGRSFEIIKIRGTNTVSLLCTPSENRGFYYIAIQGFDVQPCPVAQFRWFNISQQHSRNAHAQNKPILIIIDYKVDTKSWRFPRSDTTAIRSYVVRCTRTVRQPFVCVWLNNLQLFVR